MTLHIRRMAFGTLCAYCTVYMDMDTDLDWVIWLGGVSSIVIDSDGVSTHVKSS